MQGIVGMGPLGGSRLDGVGRKRVGGRFSVPDTAAAAESEAAAAMGGAVPVSMLLAFQEAETDAGQDRDAARHAGAALDALARLQVALLRGETGAELAALAQALHGAPPPADPRLAEVQKAVLVRTAVELARARAAASA